MQNQSFSFKIVGCEITNMKTLILKFHNILGNFVQGLNERKLKIDVRNIEMNSWILSTIESDQWLLNKVLT